MKVLEDNWTNNLKWYKKEIETLNLFNVKNEKNNENKNYKTVETMKNYKRNTKSLIETTDHSKSSESKN